MSAELEAVLRAVLADPAKMSALTPEQEQGLVASLRAVLGGQLAPPALAPATPQTARDEDDLLDVAEAAAVLKVSPRWLYRRAGHLPFARRLSRKVLRFSQVGMTRWLATKRL